jgi:hypothetical protein
LFWDANVPSNLHHWQLTFLDQSIDCSLRNAKSDRGLFLGVQQNVIAYALLDHGS